MSNLNILDGYERAVCIPPAFTGATSNTRGDKDGSLTSFKLFEVVGDVKVIVWGVCTLTLVGAGTLEVGLLNNTALVLPQVADATGIATGEHYVAASVTSVGGFAATALPAAKYITAGNDIYETSGTADITAGNMYYVCLWTPITPNSKVKTLYPQAV